MITQEIREAIEDRKMQSLQKAVRDICNVNADNGVVILDLEKYSFEMVNVLANVYAQGARDMKHGLDLAAGR